MIEAPHFTRQKALLYPAARVYEWGTTLVVAPYSDHQWLGCAGALALLRQMGYRVRVLLLGNPSVPMHSALIEAMTHLKISEPAVINLQLRSGSFPHPGSPGFEEATRLVICELENLNPDSLLMPLLRNELSDLLATRQIIDEARRQFSFPLKAIEYPLLNTQTLTDPVTKPTHEYDVWRLDVREAMDEKIAALQEFSRFSLAQAPSPEYLPAWEGYREYRG